MAVFGAWTMGEAFATAVVGGGAFTTGELVWAVVGGGIAVSGMPIIVSLRGASRFRLTISLIAKKPMTKAPTAIMSGQNEVGLCGACTRTVGVRGGFGAGLSCK